MPFIVYTPSGLGLIEQFILDGLGLNDNAAWTLRNEEIDMAPPPMRAEWIGAADSEYQDLVRAPLHENRKIILPLQAKVGTATKDQALDFIAALQDKLIKAGKTRGGIPLTWTPRGSSRTATFDVLAGEITGMPLEWFFSNKNLPKPTITLTCKPYWRGAEITGPSASSSTPFVALAVTNVSGDISATGRLVVTDGASQARRHVEWGLEGPDTYDPATSLLIDSDDMVVTGATGVQAVTTGAYDPNASGNNSISAALTTAQTLVAATGNLAHVGTFRVCGRVQATGVGVVQVRFSWRSGDGQLAANPWVTLRGGSLWEEWPLGQIVIPDVTLGAQRWIGQIEARTTTGTDTLKVDYLELIPTANGYGKARALIVDSTGNQVGLDAFTATTAGNALNTRAAPLGGTWTTSGDATDLTFYDAIGGVAQEGIQRATTAFTVGRFAVLGATNYTDIDVSARVRWSSYPGAATTIDLGVLARYVDNSNFLRFIIEINPLPALFAFYIDKKVGGAQSTIVSSTPALPVTVRNALTHTLRLRAFASGRVIAQMIESDGTVSVQLDSSHADVATGGVLATGKPGLFDGSSSTAPAVTRYYDDVSVAVPAAEPIVINSGRSVEIRTDAVERLDGTGVYGGRPSSYLGSRFLLPVGASRVMAKARRNDIDLADDSNVTDSTTAQVFYTPRGLVVPR